MKIYRVLVCDVNCRATLITLEKESEDAFATVVEAFDATIEEIERQVNYWTPAAKAVMKSDKLTLDADGLYRGGAILKLAELMRKHSHTTALRAGLKHSNPELFRK